MSPGLISRLLFVSFLGTQCYLNCRAQVLLSPEQAAKAAFPKSTAVNKLSLALTEDEKTRAQQLAQAPIEENIFTFYEIKAKEKILGHAGLHSAKVRTKDQTAFVAIDPKGAIVSVELIAFYEHPEYLPPKGWNQVFVGKNLRASLKSGQDIPIITGSTLTTERLAQAARIIRGIWQVKLQKKKK
ncbi:MAG: FMN-binding protein [Bdellovibrionales bacterium]|nr:FMN-binding protein [Bdellovibrionales bacterium]